MNGPAPTGEAGGPGEGDPTFAGMSRTLLFVFLSCCLGLQAIAQDRFTASGYVTDSATGEALIGASVFIEELARACPPTPTATIRPPWNRGRTPSWCAISAMPTCAGPCSSTAINS